MAIASEGLYRSLVDATGREHAINGDVASAIAQQFALQSTLNGVAQAVVDQVVRLHHDTFMTASVEARRRACQTRDDITLIVRSFGHPLPNAMSPTSGLSSAVAPLSIVIPPAGASTPPDHDRAFFRAPQYRAAAILDNSNGDNSLRSFENQSFESGPSVGGASAAITTRLQLDEQGRVRAYVDFADFFAALDELTDAQRDALDADTEPRPEFETIPEEPVTPMTPGVAGGSH